jgi:hypothetical protein
MLTCLAGGLLLLPPSSAWAGHPQVREGFWIGFGGGWGWADIGCDECDGDDDREDSFTGFLKLGGTINDRVLLGVESNGWTKDEDGTRVTLGALTGTVTFYPKAQGGFFLKGGAGLSYVSLDIDEDEFFFGASASKTGWGVLAGAGYDLRVGRNVSITPSFNFYYGKPGDLDFGDGDILGGLNMNVISIEIGITFH